MKRRESAAPVGAGMLLGSFAVLCLVAFAALYLSSAGAEDRLSRASAETLLARREADAEAEAILARLRAGEVPEGVRQENDVYDYTVPIAPDRELQVSVRRAGETYTVLSWREVPTGDWQADERLTLWDGEGGS